MKKILFFAALAAGMVSCTSEEPVQVSDSYAIGFNTYVGKATRAGDVNTESLTAFAVYGGTEANEFKGTQVTKQSGAWTYSPVQYWAEGEKYNFAAVAPAVEGASYSAKKLTIANYSPADDDLIVASTNEITGAAAGANTAVTLNFKHALSKVQFTFDGDLSRLSDVKLSAVSNKANLEVTYAEGTTAAWGASAGTGEYTYAIDATSGMGVKYLLPQTIGDDVKVSYKYNGKDHAIQVKTTDVAAWEMGKAYNYKVSLASDAIAFEAVEAAAWTTVDLVPTEVTPEEPGEEPGKEPGEEPGDIVPVDVTLKSFGGTWIRSSASGNKYYEQPHMEIQKNGDTNFFGLVGFELPENLKVNGYKLTATLRLVTTQCKGDRNIDLYEYNGEEFVDTDATWNKYGETCLSIVNDNDPVATFQAQGLGSRAMGDTQVAEEANTKYKEVANWTNYIDLTNLVNTKDSGSKLTLIVTKQVDGSQSFKFATHRAADIVNETADVTFAAADLVPQLVITYTKE